MDDTECPDEPSIHGGYDRVCQREQLLAEVTMWRERAERAEAALQWRPIETAPRDGTKLLTCDMVGNIYLDWRDDNSKFLYEREWYGYPTHWMPLPEPPTADAAEGSDV